MKSFFCKRRIKTTFIKISSPVLARSNQLIVLMIQSQEKEAV